MSNHRTPETAFEVVLPRSAKISVIAEEIWNKKSITHLTLVADTAELCRLGKTAVKTRTVGWTKERKALPQIIVFADAPSQTWVYLQAVYLDGTRNAITPRFKLIPGEHREFYFQSSSWGAVKGKVLTTEGKPISNAIVTLSEGSPDPNPSYSLNISDSAFSATTTTNRNGSFEIRNVPKAKWQLAVESGTSEARIPSTTRLIRVSEGETTPEIEISLTENKFVHGRVVDENGSGLSDITFWAHTEGMSGSVLGESSDQEGRFRIGPLMEGTVFLEGSGTVNGHTYFCSLIKLENSDREIQIVAQEGILGEGKVVLQDGSAAQNVFISFYRLDSGKREAVATSRESGRFSTEHLRLGEYCVYAEDRAGNVALKKVSITDPRDSQQAPILLHLKNGAFVQFVSERTSGWWQILLENPTDGRRITKSFLPWLANGIVVPRGRWHIKRRPFLSRSEYELITKIDAKTGKEMRVILDK